MPVRKGLPMKNTTLAVLLTLMAQGHALAATGQAEDYSGIYQCTGKDAHTGDYTGIVTLKRLPSHSKGAYASYDFKLEVPGFGEYPGHAAGQGNYLAMHFALTDQSTKDYGTGIATFKRNSKGQMTFHKFYFEPEYEGGNTGTEDCVRK